MDASSVGYAFVVVVTLNYGKHSTLGSTVHCIISPNSFPIAIGNGAPPSLMHYTLLGVGYAELDVEVLKIFADDLILE